MTFKNHLLPIFLVFFNFFKNSHHETHYLLDPEDGQIKFVHDSPFMLAQPHSLHDFVNQIKMVDEIKEIREDVAKQKKEIEQRYKRDDPEIEKKIRENDSNCLKSKNLELQTDNFISIYTIDLLPYLEKIPGFRISEIPSTKETLTKKRLRDIFSQRPPISGRSMMNKEYFLPMCASPENLEKLQHGEIDYNTPEKEFSSVSEKELSDIGVYLANQLKEGVATDFMYYYSAIFWRVKGSDQQAIECLKKHISLAGAPDAAWFQLATMFIKFGKYDEAAEILGPLTTRVPSCGTCLLALGDVYVLNGNFEMAIKMFDKAVSVDSKQELAEQKAALLKCTNRLLKVLEDQHNNLLATIDDVETHNDKLKRLRELENEVEKKKASSFARLQSTWAYEHLTYGPIPHLNCRGVVDAKKKHSLFCQVENWEAYNSSLMQKYEQMLENELKNRKKLSLEPSQAEIYESEMFERMKVAQGELREYLEKIQPYIGLEMDEPSNRPKYPLEKYPDKKTMRHFDISWPTKEECHHSQKKMPYLLGEIMPQFFVSPENKGYEVYDLLTKYVGLAAQELHPLPWVPPYCGNYVEEKDWKISENVHFSVFEANKKDGVFIEVNLHPILERLVAKQGELVIVAEIGQRIGNLIKYNIGPKWLAFNLAALYWRAFGVPREAVLCIKAALETSQHKDLAYAQLGQIILRMGEPFLDDSMNFLRLSLDENPNEPITNFLVGVVHYFKGQPGLANEFSMKSLEIDPYFDPAKDFLFSMRCEIKGHRRCFTISDGENPKDEVHFDYNRCGGVYTAKSYKPPGYATLLIPLLYTNAERQNREIEKIISRLVEDFEPENDLPNDDVPVLPLDYGGFSEDRLLEFNKFANLEDYQQFSLVYPEIKREPETNQETTTSKPSTSTPKTELTIEKPKRRKKLPSLDLILDKRKILIHDLPLPEKLPEPARELVDKGKFYFKPPKLDDLETYCFMYKKNPKVLEQPASTYVSVTAKGVDIEDYMDVTTIVPGIANLEPVCPEIDADSRKTLDDLPAYKFREQFKFYKPEKALKDALQSLGHEKERIEHVAARLLFAMKVSKLQPKIAEGQDAGISWVLTTASTLYWRVKGDAVNAIKCLRHSLNNAPENMRDVSLINMANIYHQAGFLHSALVASGEALEISPNMVAIHFTLANIYASMGDFSRALQFYYSTLALQANFPPAKERIRAIFCQTGGKVQY